jgi:hypothetical protein
MTDYISLVKQVANAEEVWEEHRFSIYRNRRALTLTILDQGAAETSQRYMVSVKGANQGDNTVSHGNPGATVEEALHNVHWWEFD